MAEEKKVTEVVEETPAVETVSKADYDRLVVEYKRVVAAYNKLLGVVANDYAEKVSKSIFDELDK